MRPNDSDRTETQNFERKWCFSLDLPWFKLCLRAVWSSRLQNITLELVLYAWGWGEGHYHIIAIFSWPKIRNIRRTLFRQLSREGNLHGSGMSHATTASPKPSFRAPWRVGNAVVGRGNAGWTTSKSEHSCCPCQNCPQGPPAESDRKRISAESAVIAISPTNQSAKGLNWTELIHEASNLEHNKWRQTWYQSKDDR